MTEKPKPTLFDKPENFLRLGLSLIEADKANQAHSLVAKAMADHPGDALVRELGRRILTHKVPGFHHSMLEDHERNTAYRTAIERTAPGRIVLDIGTGSGLLAMMAARAGAARVVACEANTVLARTAREIIAANGLTDKIEVHACNSNKLDRMRDLHGGAELVISEIFADDLLGEGVLPSLDHARRELCASDALFVPPAASVRIALASHPMRPHSIGTVEGFDLSAFSIHIPAPRRMNSWETDLALQSDAAELLGLTFEAGTELPLSGTSHAALTSPGGLVSGLLYWIHLDFGEGVTYENNPSDNRGQHWAMHYLPFNAPRDTAAGDKVQVSAFHDGAALVVWAD